MQPADGARRRCYFRDVTVTQRRSRLALLMLGIAIAVGLIASALSDPALPSPPKPRPARSAGRGNPFAYVPAREAEFVTRGASGNAHALFVKSPGGVLATAGRVAAFRGLIDHAAAGTSISPNLLEGLVFVESAGRPQIIAGADPAGAAGLTQILAQTGQSLLGMHVDLTASRRLTSQIAAVTAGARPGRLAPLLTRRAAADERFDPALELAATVRYLELSERQFGRQDLAFESYHMGIGNLHQALVDYDGGRSVPYAQLYFDTAPDRHRAAYSLLARLSDDSSLYYWRLLGAVAVMHLYRTDRVALRRLASQQAADAAGAAVLHPAARTLSLPDPGALAAAYQRAAIVPLPSNGPGLGLELDPTMGAGAHAIGAPASLYRGLRPAALRLLIELAARVRALSGGADRLRIRSTVSDARYQRQVGVYDPPATTGYSFQIDRSYVSGAQAQALQSMLDRLQSLDLIAWAPAGAVIEVTVASDAASF